MNSLLTVAKAAEMVGLSKNTIYKAIKNGELSAATDKSGKRIDVSELLRVYPGAKHSSVPGENVELEIQYLKEKIEDLKIQLAECRERERRVMDMLAIKVSDSEPKKQGILARIFGFLE